MKKLTRSLFTVLFLLSFIHLFHQNCIAAEEQVTFYPTYGYQKSGQWIIPLRVWVHEPRTFTEAWLSRLTSSLGKLDSSEMANFRHRIQDFVADSESREQVILIFDQDPEKQEYRIQDNRGSFPASDRNGLIEGEIKIPFAKAKSLLQLQASKDWLSYQAKSKGHLGQGRIQLIEPTGISVISDIDDTIKVTEIPLGWKTVIKNTFFRDFVAAPNMANLYQSFRGASFHYVSGGPWQLYRPLAEFLFNSNTGFPEGSFHMKSVGKNLLSARTWEDLKELISNENATYDQKIAQISLIMQHFPERKFILIGDSGEKDPEVYWAIQKKFPGQILEIKIRDVVNDQKNNKTRLEGMTILAP